MHVNGVCDKSPHQLSSVLTQHEAGADQKKRSESCVESCCETRFDVERRVERCCMTGFSLQAASGGGIGVPAGRPTEDIVGRDTSSAKNDNNNDDEHQRHTNDNRKDLGFEESASEVGRTTESVRSSVVRGSCMSDIVNSLVEDLSLATTKINNSSDDVTTTYENDNDKDETARRATFNAGHVDRQKTSSGGSPNKDPGSEPKCRLSGPSQGVSFLDGREPASSRFEVYCHITRPCRE